MFNEFDVVVLSHDIKDYGLTNGDVGTIVHSYTDNKGYEVNL